MQQMVTVKIYKTKYYTFTFIYDSTWGKSGLKISLSQFKLDWSAMKESFLILQPLISLFLATGILHV